VPVAEPRSARAGQSNQCGSTSPARAGNVGGRSLLAGLVSAVLLAGCARPTFEVMFDGLSDRARNATMRAVSAANVAQRGFLGAEHLLMNQLRVAFVRLREIPRLA